MSISECAPNAGNQAHFQLLQLYDITKLSERRLYLDLCIMFKIVHGLFNFPSGIFNTYSGRFAHSNKTVAQIQQDGGNKSGYGMSHLGSFLL